MGKCSTIFTLTGAASLGLLTGSMAYQSMRKIPDLIRQLNQQASLKSASAEPVLAAIRTNFTLSGVSNAVLASLSTWLLSAVYRNSAASGKHPFLVYSAFAAPLALVALYYQTGSRTCTFTGPFGNGCVLKQAVCGRISKMTGKCCGEKEVKEETSGERVAAEPAQDETPMDLSYIHVSEDSLASDSSPETPIEVTQSVSPSIEGEVEDALAKKERVRDLETVGAAYKVASAIAGLGFAICLVGILGDQYFL